MMFFIKLIWLGVGFLNRTGAETGYLLDKKCKNIIFYYWKNWLTSKARADETPHVVCARCIFAALVSSSILKEKMHLKHFKHFKDTFFDSLKSFWETT